MSKILLRCTATLSFLFFVAQAKADLVSEFGVSLSKTSVNQFLSQISGDLKIEDEPVELEKEGILKDLNYSSTSLFLDADIDFEFVEGDAVAAHADVRSVGIKLKDFNYTQITDIKRTGVNARVITSMSCTELVIELNDWSVDLKSPVSFKDGDIILDRENGSLDPIGTKVRVDLSKCKSPRGIDGVLREMILEWISTAEGNKLLFGAVLDYGQDFIDVEFDKLKNVLNLEILDKRIDLVFEAVSFLEEKIEVVGLLKAESKNNDYRLTMNRADFDSAKTGADVILPKEFFSKMFPDFMKEVTVDFEIKREAVPQVDFLFNNRFIQFFVWGDLLNFKKSSDFAAGVKVDTKDLVLKSMDSSFKYQLRGNHRIDMDFLSSRGTRFPYMDFTGGMASDLSLSFTDNGISIGLSDPDLSAKASWDSSMSSWRKSKPKGKPWMSVILPRIKKALKKTSFEYSWTDLGLGEYIRKADLYQSDRSMILGVSLN